MINVSEFRELSDQAPDDISCKLDDLEALYRHYNISFSNSQTLSAVTDYLYNIIRRTFSTNHEQVWYYCKLIQRQLIFQYVLSGESLEPYISIAEHIQDALRQPPTVVHVAGNWQTAINAASDVTKILQRSSTVEEIKKLHARDFAVADAAKNLCNQGYAVNFEDGIPHLSETDDNKFPDYLSGLIIKLGGINLAGQIFYLLEGSYDPKQERYHLVREANTSSEGVAPQLPYGYLFQLAAKYPSLNQSVSCNSQSVWKELADLITDRATLYNVQPYNTFELMFKGSKSIIPFLQELAVYDTLFTIPQMRPFDAIRLIKGIFDWIDWEQEQPRGWKLREAVEVAEAILSKACMYHGPVPITARELIPLCPNTRSTKVFDILEYIFSHKSPGANQDFRFPTDTPGPDFMFRPLLSDGQGTQWLLDARACAPAFMEALMKELRHSNSNLNDKTGPAIERFLQKELSARGVSFVCGKYQVDGQEGECDIAIETRDCIIFLEVKKKPLVRQARAGCDTSILLDLSASLIDAQLQAGRHELLIRKYGKIKLKDIAGNIKILELANRKIERIAITLLDYGSFQDRVVLRQFIETSLRVYYSPHDPKLEGKFEKLSQKLQQLCNQVQELIQFDENVGKNKNAFMNYWFLSVPQLLILLDHVTCNDDFKRALWKTRHVTTGSLDFYYELHAALQR